MLVNIMQVILVLIEEASQLIILDTGAVIQGISLFSMPFFFLKIIPCFSKIWRFLLLLIFFFFFSFYSPFRDLAASIISCHLSLSSIFCSLDLGAHMCRSDLIVFIHLYLSCPLGLFPFIISVITFFICHWTFRHVLPILNV